MSPSYNPHALHFDVRPEPTAEEAALAFVRAHDDMPTGHLEIWAVSRNAIVQLRANALLAARRAMAREGLR